MRIIGGRDFYDFAVPYVDDPRQPVFIRSDFQKTEPIDDYLHLGSVIDDIRPAFDYKSRRVQWSYSDTGWWFEGSLYSYHRKTVIVAGVVYQCFVLKKTTENKDHSKSIKRTYCWNVDSFLEALSNIDITIEEPRRKSKWERRYRMYAEDVREYMEPRPFHDMDYLVNNGIVIAISTKSEFDREWKWKVNTDGLDAFQFYNAVDQTTLYQEIDMFLGHVATRNENLVEVSAKDRIAQHGFDKFSFRNQIHPGKPRSRGRDQASG